MTTKEMIKVILIPLLWMIFKKSKSLPIKPLIHWQLDPRKHGHKLTPVRISTDHMFTCALYGPVLLVSTIELINQRYDFVYSSRYCIGFLMGGIATSIIKVIVSRPRPNAIAIEETCKQASPQASSTSLAEVRQKPHVARQSFLSGHAFGGVFASTFTTLFLAHSFPSLSLATRSLLFLSGLIPGLTQAIDHWHHETDVFAGWTFGLTTAVLSFCS